MKIGFYGGTFDPVHRGHIKVAKELINLGYCDRIYLMPNKNSFGKNPASFEHRFNMCEAATERSKNIEVTNIESRFPDSVETYNIVNEYILPVYGGYNQIFFISGIDVAKQIPEWKTGQKLIDSIPHIVVGTCNSWQEYWFENEPHSIVNIPTPNIHSSALRCDLNQKRCEYFLPYIPLSVLDYIFEQELY